MLEKLRPLGERWPWFGTALRTQVRMGDVNGNQLAASVTLSAFLALFPLLLVAIAVVGFVSSNDPSLANDLVKNLGLPDERVFNNIQKYGNTTAATLPLVFHEAKRQGRIRPGDLVCFAALGAGLHWGAGLMRA